LQCSEGLFKLKYEDFIKITRLSEDISREMEASVQKYKAFIKISIISEGFFRGIQALGLRGFLNTFLVALRLFQSDVSLLSQCLCGLYKIYCAKVDHQVFDTHNI
jgi:hypothetical protein